MHFLLDDNPSTVDKLGFEPRAKVLTDVILNVKRPPFTIGVFGEWGGGKTSLMKMVEAQLRSQGTKTVWFNAWKYDGKEAIWNALIQQIFYTMKMDPDIGKRQDAEDFKKRVSLIAGELAKYAAKVATRLIPGGIIKEDDVDSLIAAIRPANANDPQFEFINKFESTFDELVNDYTGKNATGTHSFIVVFIDDLDRCLPENAITALEALKLYLDRANCVFVIGAESSIIEEGILQRYKGSKYLSASEYFEKIVQLPFHMPKIEDGNALQLLEGYEDILALSDPVIKKLVTRGTGCNPRRIKRFINVFAVISFIKGRSLTLEEQQHLAKILLIQMGFPDCYCALLSNLNLIKELTDLFSDETPIAQRRANISAAKEAGRKDFLNLMNDEELTSFLKETKEIPCSRDKIEDWVVLTKGQQTKTVSESATSNA